MRLPLASVSHGWRALRHRNFRLYFAGQGISLIGTWMTRLATGWLVYRLTGSPLLLGIVSFAGQIAAFVLGPLAGVWVERLERRRLLVWTQVLGAVQSLALAALTIPGLVTIPEIIGLSVLQGLINAFDMPARQAFLVQMVDDRGDLSNAIAINSAMANGARLIGPALAGLVIAVAGEGTCFLIDGISYLAVIASLLAMRIGQTKRSPHRPGLWHEVREGWTYVSAPGPVRSALALLFLVALLGWPTMVLLPVFAKAVLHGGPQVLGWLSAALGVGAVSSGISLALRKSFQGLSHMLLVSAVLLGLALVGFGFTHTLWPSLLLMAAIGFGLIETAAITNTLIQSIVPEDKRARTMSYYTMTFFGSAPVGSLIAGALAQRYGAPHTVFLAGLCCLATAVWFNGQVAAIRQATELTSHA